MTDSRPRIMVVDDNPGMRLTLEGTIEDEGFDVVGVADGYEAIPLARKGARGMVERVVQHSAIAAL